jgi:hypothetical protein
VNSTPYPCCANQRSIVAIVSIGLTAYEIVDNTKAVDGGDEAGWDVEVVVLEVPLVERVIGATSLRGALPRRFVGA